MVTVTTRAKEELKRVVEIRSLGPGKFLRLAVPPVWVGEGDFGIVVDDQGPEDQEFSFQGLRVLLVDSDLANRLSTSVLDFKQSAGVSRFTLDVF